MNAQVAPELRENWDRAAAHEAGHAVAARMVGLSVRDVRIWQDGNRPDSGVAGVTRIGDGRRRLVGTELADALLVVALAGTAAETLWLRRTVRRIPGPLRRDVAAACRTDQRNARRAAHRSTLSLPDGRARAGDLVRANWPDVRRVAVLLGRSGHLSGSAV